MACPAQTAAARERSLRASAEPEPDPAARKQRTWRKWVHCAIPRLRTIREEYPTKASRSGRQSRRLRDDPPRLPTPRHRSIMGLNEIPDPGCNLGREARAIEN